MSKTNFSSGVVITSKWLNGAQNISFDGLEEDWHYPPLTSDSVKLSGEGGFDGVFVTVSTSQYVPGSKVFGGQIEFNGGDFDENLAVSPITAPAQTTSWEAQVGSPLVKLETFGEGLITGTILKDSISTIDGGEIA